jgi:hypothetical protein
LTGAAESGASRLLSSTSALFSTQRMSWHITVPNIVV